MKRIQSSESGSALLIILILLGLMTALMVSNSVILHRLKVELQLLEQKQQRSPATVPSEPAEKARR